MTFLEFFSSSRYISFCENQLAQQRSDFQERLREKDAEIRRLRAVSNSRSDTMGTEPKRVDPPVDTREGPIDWQGGLSQLLNEENTDGISE